MPKLPVLLAALLFASAPLVAPSQIAAASGPVKYGFVVNGIVLPANNSEARSLGHDLDHDGEADNQLGLVFGVLAGQGFDLRSAANDAITSGVNITLLSVQTTSLRNARTATVRLFRGKPEAAPDLDGGGIFRVDTTAPKAELTAKIRLHQITTKPGAVPITLPALYPGLPAVRLILRSGRIAAYCTTKRCTKGVISGGISVRQVNRKIIPAFAAMARAYVAADCPSTPPDACPNGTSGQRMLQLFDSNHDLAITDSEVRNNGLVGALFAPDVDLVGDSANDSLSFGFGFTAAQADVRGD